MFDDPVVLRDLSGGGGSGGGRGGGGYLDVGGHLAGAEAAAAGGGFLSHVQLGGLGLLAHPFPLGPQGAAGVAGVHPLTLHLGLGGPGPQSLACHHLTGVLRLPQP